MEAGDEHFQTGVSLFLLLNSSIHSSIVLTNVVSPGIGGGWMHHLIVEEAQLMFTNRWGSALSCPLCKNVSRRDRQRELHYTFRQQRRAFGILWRWWCLGCWMKVKWCIGAVTWAQAAWRGFAASVLQSDSPDGIRFYCQHGNRRLEKYC